MFLCEFEVHCNCGFYMQKKTNSYFGFLIFFKFDIYNIRSNINEGEKNSVFRNLI
jgi:hypothetical protein